MSVHSILEDVLRTHPAVADAAVVPSPDEHAGEVPKAFVVPRRLASPRELIAWVAEQVAPYPRIRRVEFIEVRPSSDSNEILRALLADRERSALVTPDAKRPLAWPRPRTARSEPLAA